MPAPPEPPSPVEAAKTPEKPRQEPAAETPAPAKAHGNGNGNEKKAQAPAAESGADSNGGRAVLLEINESENAIEDAHVLREVIQVLLEYPGKDRVNLRIHTQGKWVLMECPVVSVEYCPELKERLQPLLGEDSVSLQDAAIRETEDVPF